MKIEDLRNKLGPVKNLAALARGLTGAYPAFVHIVQNDADLTEKVIEELIDESSIDHDFLVNELGFQLEPHRFFTGTHEYIKTFTHPDDLEIHIVVAHDFSYIKVEAQHTGDHHDNEVVPIMKPLTKRQFRNLHDIYSI